MNGLAQTLPHIGIVAGTADGAALCYRTLCHEAENLLDRHAQPEITVHTFPLALYLDGIEREDWAGVAALMSQSAARLVQAGADLIICPNNTLHRAFELAVSSVPWLHIAHTVAAEIIQRKFQCVGLIGTREVMEGSVYLPKLTERGIDVVLPEPHKRVRLQHIIRTELILGEYRSASRTYVQDLIAELAAKGAEAVILGCTELPLLLSEKESAPPFLDSTRILARAALHWAKQSRQRPPLLTSLFQN